MKSYLLVSGLLLALPTCDSSPSTSRVGAGSTSRHPAGLSPQHLPAPVATSPLSTYAPATSPTLTVDTLALLHRAKGSQLPGYVVDHFAVGDLNQDHRPDFLVVYRQEWRGQRRAGGTTTVEEGQLAVVLNQGWPQLRLAAVAPLGCLGTGCTFRGITVKGRYFSVERLEGDCEKTYTVHTYRYAPAQRNWQLYKIGERLYSMCNYNSGEEEYHEQTRRDFGRVVFGQ